MDAAYVLSSYQQNNYFELILVKVPAQKNPLEQISHPLSTPLGPLENNIQPPPKRRKTTHEAVTHLIGKENKSVEIVSAVMKASKIPERLPNHELYIQFKCLY
jgi:hypothetical protein